MILVCNEQNSAVYFKLVEKIYLHKSVNLLLKPNIIVYNLEGY